MCPFRPFRPLGLCLLLLFSPGCGDDTSTNPQPPSTSVKVEAENKTDQFDRGEANMAIVSWANASGGKAVEGFDKLLEWIEIPAEFSRSGSYRVAFRHASFPDVKVRVTLAGAGPDSADVEWILQLNAGCG
jgi:hypothetical protein